jgi:hypothetical protein
VKELGSCWSAIASLLTLAAVVAMVGCQGLGAGPTPTPNNNGGLGLQSTSLNFGEVTVGDSRSLTDTLVNQSNGKITVTRAVAANTEFKLDSPTLPFTLEAGQSAALAVSFHPTQAGSRAGSFSIGGEGPKQSTLLSLSGTAVAAPQLTVSPSTLAFGTVQVGNNRTQTATLTNSGTGTLTISQAVTTGTGFRVSGLALPVNLSAGQSVNCSVAFAPQSSGSFSGSLSVTINSFVSSGSRRRRTRTSSTAVVVPLTGTGSLPGTVSASPSSIGFGSVSVGTSQTTSETVKNAGGSAITISQATTTGAGFSISGLALPLSLSPGQSKTITVAFAPQSTGLASGNIAITSNGSNPALNISLSGTGVSAATVVASPSALNFGSVQVGGSTSLSGTITNSGSAAVTISQANITGSAFAVSGLTLPLSLNPSQSANFNVSFAPAASGTLTGNLAIVSNASNPTLNVALSGTAVAPGSLNANPSTLSFGSVQTGSNKTLSVSITNSGGSSVTVSQVTASGTAYSVSGITPPVTLNAGQSYTFSVNFAPTSAGSSAGSIAVMSNASNPTLAIPLSGAGTSPGTLSVSPASMSFGNVTVGAQKSLTATISASTAPVTVSSAGVSSLEFAVSGLTFPFTLAAGSSASFTVTFTPQASGTASGSISFSSNATNSPTVESLGGSGIPAPQHSVALSWNASTSTVAGYNVYRGAVSGGPYTKINAALDALTSYTDTNVLGGQTYYYVVTAVDGSGSESTYSNQVQAVIPTP